MNLIYLNRWSRYLINDLKDSLYSDPKTTYLISFPKTGVTWLKYMLAQILSKTYDLECNQTVNINKLSKQYKRLPNIVWTHDDSHILGESGKLNNIEKVLIYNGRFRYRKNCVILLVRDPRDVVVSHYYQVTNRSNIPLEFNSISEFVRHEHYGFKRIIRFYQIWDRNRSVPKRLLIVRYEDLLTNGPAILTKILNFVDAKNFDTAIVNQVYEECHADKMRKLEMQGQVEGMRVFGTDQNSLKVRRAQSGSYKDELSEDDIQYCNELMSKMPSIYGYSIS
ncbi:MAG: sulfotransferase domain-containing protein [Cyanobacteria bacterium P01_G01_bin.19]